MKIIANSLPKSGTHVLTRVLDLAGLIENKMHFSGSLVRQASKNPIRNLIKSNKISYDLEDSVPVDLDIQVYLKEKHFRKMLNEFPDNTYSQGHLPYSDKTVKLLEQYNVKMIYIIRDPRDVLISHFHHHFRDKHYEGYSLMNSLDNNKDRILLSLYGFNENNVARKISSLRDRVINSMEWYRSNSDLILPLKFEEIIGSKGGSEDTLQIKSLSKIENFLNLKEGTLINQRNDIFYTNASTFRKGKINDWKNYFDQDIKNQVYAEVGDILTELGYKL